MALKIKQSDTFWWPVTVMVPVDGGRHDKQTFDVEFARLGISEAERLVGEIGTGERSELDGFRQMVKGWRGVLDADEQEVPFSDGALQQVLDIPTVGASILEAFRGANNEVARRKN